MSEGERRRRKRERGPGERQLTTATAPARSPLCFTRIYIVLFHPFFSLSLSLCFFAAACLLKERERERESFVVILKKEKKKLSLALFPPLHAFFFVGVVKTSLFLSLNEIALVVASMLSSLLLPGHPSRRLRKPRYQPSTTNPCVSDQSFKGKTTMTTSNLKKKNQRPPPYQLLRRVILRATPSRLIL